MFDLPRHLQGTQDHILPSHILLQLSQETRTNQPKKRQISMSRMPSANRFTQRQLLRQFADQFLPQ